MVHREFYGAISLARLVQLDGATGFAALAAGGTALCPSYSTRGRGKANTHWARVVAFVAAGVVGAGAAFGWAMALRAGEDTAPRRHMLWQGWRHFPKHRLTTGIMNRITSLALPGSDNQNTFP